MECAKQTEVIPLLGSTKQIRSSHARILQKICQTRARLFLCEGNKKVSVKEERHHQCVCDAVSFALLTPVEFGSTQQSG